MVLYVYMGYSRWSGDRLGCSIKITSCAVTQ